MTFMIIPNYFFPYFISKQLYSQTNCNALSIVNNYINLIFFSGMIIYFSMNRLSE